MQEQLEEWKNPMNKKSDVCNVILFLSSCLMAVSCNDAPVGFSAATPNVAITSRASEDLKRITTQEFAAGTVEKFKVDIDTKFRTIDQSIVLREKPKIVELIKQEERPLQSALFTQGFDGWPASQKFGVKEKGKLDLLVVIDNSYSMAVIQNRLSKNMAPLLKYVANTNWQIGFVTTSSGCLRTTSSGKRTITREDFDKDPVETENMFKELINAGEAGSSTEMGIYYAAQAMIGNCGNPKDDWKRPGSHTVVLIITDEKNCGSASNDGKIGCKDQEHSKAEYFIARAPANTQVHGLFLLQDNFDLCPDSGGYDDQYPAEYIRLVQMTGGKYGEVCQMDYSSILEEVSADIDHDTVQKFELSFAPENGVVTAMVDGTPLADGFVVEDKFVVMQRSLPETASSIEFAYRHSAKPRFTKLTLPSVPDHTSLTVKLNGRLLTSSEYTYVAEQKTLEFAVLPPDNAKIQIDYRDNRPLPTTFPVTQGVDMDESSLVVEIAGQAVSDIKYDPESGMVEFARAPLDGEQIKISYNKKGDKQTRYKVDGIQVENIESVAFTDNDTAAEVPAQIVGGEIVVDEKEVYDGRIVLARYNPLFKGEDLSFSIPVNEEPLEGTLRAVANNTNQDICSDTLKYENGQVSFRCIDEDMTRIAVDFDYVKDFTNQFHFYGIVLKDAEWIVTIDGQETMEYERVEHDFTLPAELLQPGSVVTITRIPPKLKGQMPAPNRP
jgi:hypothetical protein